MKSDSKNIKIELLLLAILAAMSGCVPEPLDTHGIPKLDSKIVVSSQVLPGFAIAVLLTKSIGALDANGNSDPRKLLDQIVITDATVRLEGGGASYDLPYIENGLYAISSISLAVNQSYTLKVNSPSLGSVRAVTRAKPKVEFDDIDVNLYLRGLDTLVEVKYTFKDVPGMNWYMVNAQRVSNENFEEQLLNPWITTKIFDDTSFTNGIKQDTFHVLFNRVNIGDTLSVVLSNIEEDYYNFMKVRGNSRFGFATYFGEPVNYPSNVEGGLGFFTLYAPDIRLFLLR